MKTAILGAGGWGTALAVHLATKLDDLLLRGHNPERVCELKKTRQNASYLPGIVLPENIRVTGKLEDCAAADLILFVTPSKALRAVAQDLKSVLRNPAAILLTCTKGIEHGTGLRMSEIIRDCFPGHPVAVLSGPNLATEISRGLPTATVLGCTDTACACSLQRHLGSSRFRVYTSDEVTGIELGGALKNTFAIAAGVSDGFGLGDNSKAALVTRALAELLRLGVAMGGESRTFYGLSGAGDLIATCFSRHSRNRLVGEQLGQGKTLAEITNMKMVAEGIPTTKSAYECARKLNVETPIIDQVYGVLYEGKPAAQALQELLERDQKAERH